MLCWNYENEKKAITFYTFTVIVYNFILGIIRFLVFLNGLNEEWKEVNSVMYMLVYCAAAVEVSSAATGLRDKCFLLFSCS